MYLTVSPAYGREYKSGKAAKADWDAGKDFVVETLGQGGRYINKPDAENYLPEGSSVTIRFKRMTQLTVVKVVKPKKKED